MAEANAGFNIDVQGAAAAIDEAGGLDAAFQAESGVGPTQTPDSQGTTAPTEPATQEGQYRDDETGRFASRPEAEQTPADSSFMGENFDPASLPPELQPAYKQMQAHWTRTLQQAAPYRRLAEEYQIEDPAQLREVIQFHQDLQDPSSWKAIHQELGQLLQQQGLSPAEADATATQALQQQAQQDPMAAFAEDPEFQPIRSAFDSLRNDVQSLKSELEQARETERQQQIQMAIQGEHQRQENIIRQSRPDWGDSDVESIYQLSVSMGGNLLDAAARYEAMQAQWAERFVGQKESPNPVTAETVLPGAVQAQEQGGEAGRVPTLDEAHTALMAHLRSIGAAD